MISDKDQHQMIMERNFSIAYAVSKMRAEMLLNSPELKENAISVYHMVKEIFGKIDDDTPNNYCYILTTLISSSIDVIPSGNKFFTRIASLSFCSNSFRMRFIGAIQNAFVEFDSTSNKGRHTLRIRIGIIVCRIFYIIYDRTNYAIFYCVQHWHIPIILRFRQ